MSDLTMEQALELLHEIAMFDDCIEYECNKYKTGEDTAKLRTFITKLEEENRRLTTEYSKSQKELTYQGRKATELYNENKRLNALVLMQNITIDKLQYKEPDTYYTANIDDVNISEVEYYKQRLSLYERDCDKCKGSGEVLYKRFEMVQDGESTFSEKVTSEEIVKCPDCNGTGKVRRWCVPDWFVKHIYNLAVCEDSVKDYLEEKLTKLSPTEWEISEVKKMKNNETALREVNRKIRDWRIVKDVILVAVIVFLIAWVIVLKYELGTYMWGYDVQRDIIEQRDRKIKTLEGINEILEVQLDNAHDRLMSSDENILIIGSLEPPEAVK